MHTRWLQHFDPASTNEIQSLAKMATDEHSKSLFRRLETEDLNICRLLEYGISQLQIAAPNGNLVNFSNQSLATYFFVLSELRNIPAEIRDLAIDSMLSCEDSSFPPFLGVNEVIAAYNRTQPLLKEHRG